MVERTGERPIPANWPKDQPLPTIEQARQAVREGEEVVDRLLKKSERPKIVREINDPDFVGMNPPQFLVDENGGVYKPVMGGEPSLVGSIDPDGRFHRAIIGGLISPDKLETKLES